MTVILHALSDNVPLYDYLTNFRLNTKSTNIIITSNKCKFRDVGMAVPKKVTESWDGSVQAKLIIQSLQK